MKTVYCPPRPSGARERRCPGEPPFLSLAPDLFGENKNKGTKKIYMKNLKYKILPPALVEALRLFHWAFSILTWRQCTASAIKVAPR